MKCNKGYKNRFRKGVQPEGEKGGVGHVLAEVEDLHNHRDHNHFCYRSGGHNCVGKDQ